MKYEIKDNIYKRINSKEKSNKEKKLSLLKFLKVFFLITIIIFFILFYFIIIYEEVTGKKILYPEKILVKGLTVKSSEDFIKENNLDSLIIINFFSRKLKESIKSLYYVKDVKIKFFFLNNILIEIFEKEKSFIFYDENNGVFYYLSSDGYILEKCLSIDLLNYPIVTIENVIPEIGKKINLPEWFLFVSEDKYYRKIISQIKIFKNGEIYIYLNNINFYTKFGTYFNKEKIENLILISKIIGDNDKIKYLDLSISNIGRIVEKE
ncbi:MAG: hypothetical protein N3A58_00270 [Spirochaetes bacterium]|nr:hypothetical protein [Spirochaetota bacterium]